METQEALKRYTKAWEASMDRRALSIVRITVALSKGPISFSDLVKETKMSSRTLDKWLKLGFKQGFIQKKKQPVFPWKSTYSLKQSKLAHLALITTMGGYISSLDDYYQHLVTGVHEEKVSVKEIVNRVITGRRQWLDFIFRMDASWLNPPYFDFIQIFFSAMNAISFWGTFFALNSPQVKGKARRLLLNQKSAITSM
jgi:DNA-binding HxlR family transcriptional regulator